MIVQGQLWHLLYLTQHGLRPEDIAAIEAFTTYKPDERWVMASYKAAIASLALLHNGLPVVFTAVYPTAPGCLFSWTVGHETMKNHVREWLPACRRFFNHFFESGYHRIECDVLEGFDGAERTIKHLGFEREGIRRGLGLDRRNAIMYARIKP